MSIVAEAPASSVMRWRIAAIGSNTEPSVFDSGPGSIIATGAATEPPRPMKRIRSVSNETLRCSTPCTIIRWNIHGTCSFDGARPAGAENSLPAMDDLGLHEQIAERRMQRVRGRLVRERLPRSS